VDVKIIIGDAEAPVAPSIPAAAVSAVSVRTARIVFMGRRLGPRAGRGPESPGPVRTATGK
jgi:hypothetical protein